MCCLKGMRRCPSSPLFGSPFTLSCLVPAALPASVAATLAGVSSSAAIASAFLQTQHKLGGHWPTFSLDQFKVTPGHLIMCCLIGLNSDQVLSTTWEPTCWHSTAVSLQHRQLLLSSGQQRIPWQMCQLNQSCFMNHTSSPGEQPNGHPPGSLQTGAPCIFERFLKASVKLLWKPCYYLDRNSSWCSDTLPCLLSAPPRSLSAFMI